MRQLSLWLGLCSILVLGTVNLSAGNVTFTDNEYGAGAYPGGVACPQGTCGYAPGSGASVIGPSAASSASGWHKYDPSTDGSAQSYLNSLLICSTTAGTCGTQTLSFTLTGSANLNIGPLGNTPVRLFRAPAGDSGYFLSTPGADTITIRAPKVGTVQQYFNTFGFYWGSIDPWNAVIFNPSGGTCNNSTNVCSTIYGTDLSSDVSITDSDHTCITAACANADTATVVFTPTCTTGATPSCDSNWTSVTFQACDSGGGCFPAFEFDNLQFDLTTCTSGYVGFACTNSVSPPFESAFESSPTPEPPGLALLGTGIAGLATVLRRKLRS